MLRTATFCFCFFAELNHTNFTTLGYTAVVYICLPREGAVCQVLVSRRILVEPRIDNVANINAHPKKSIRQ